MLEPLLSTKLTPPPFLAERVTCPRLVDLLIESLGAGGAAMRLSNSFISLGLIAGPSLAGFLFDVDPDYPFLGCAIVMLAGFGMSLFGLRDDTPKLSNPDPIG
jgi:hypothetical protein